MGNEWRGAKRYTGPMTTTATTCDHEALRYHGHSDCLTDHSEAGPYLWIVFAWPCRACGGRFAWMLAAERRDENGDWAGATSRGPVFPVPAP